MSNQFDVTTYPVAERPPAQVSKRDFILSQLSERVEDRLRTLLHQVYEDGWDEGFHVGYCNRKRAS